MKKLIVIMFSMALGTLLLLSACNNENTESLNVLESEQLAVTDTNEYDVFEYNTAPNVLSNYIGQLDALSQGLTQLATELESYVDMDNPDDPVDISFDEFETYVGRFQSYVGILQGVHNNLSAYDFYELTFGDEWPGPQPTWPMVLMNLETVLLNGLGMSHEYLSSYLSDSFVAPTSVALHYFIHEMDMGNPEESGFLGCINCITNLIALLDHVGMMMDIN